MPFLQNIRQQLKAAPPSEIALKATLAALVAGALLPVFYFYLPHVPFVTDLTSSEAVWRDSNKSRDLLGEPFFLFVFLALFLAAMSWRVVLGETLKIRQFISNQHKVSDEAIYTVSAILAVGILTAGRQLDLFLVAAAGWHLVYRHRFLRVHGQAASTLEILILVLSFDGVARALGGTPAFSKEALWVSILIEEAFIRLPPGPLALVRRGAAAIGYGFVAWWTLKFVPIWHVPASPDDWYWPQVGVTTLVLTFSGALFVLGLHTALRDPRGHIHGHSIAIALALCLKFQLPAQLILPLDDYHYGEILQPLWQALTFGQKLFVDVIPPHGMNDLAGSAMSYLLFGKITGTDVLFGETYAGLAIFGLIGILLSRKLPSVIVLLAILTLDEEPALVVAYIVLVIWLTQARYYCRLLPLYAIGSMLMAFVATGPGTAAVAASIVPIAARGFFELRTRPRMLLAWALLSLSLVTVLTIVFYTPLRQQFVYLLVSSQTNVTAYGIPWDPRWLLDLRRYSWGILTALLPVVAVLAWKAETPTAAKVGAIASAFYLLFFLLTDNSYTNGRIDPGALSRPGLTGEVLWVAFAVLSTAFPGTLSKRAALGMAGAMLSGLVVALPSPDAQLSTWPFARPATPPLISPLVPGLGRGFADPGSVARARTVKEVADKLLGSGETFLNLTNRTALYVYTARPSPIPIASVYNAAPSAFQDAAVRILAANPPALALLEASNVLHDGGKLGVRDNTIFRYVISNYVPFLYRGIIFGIRKGFESRLANLDNSPGLEFSPSSVTDTNWNAGIARPHISKAWSFFVDSAGVTADLKVGETLRFPDGSTRQIEEIQGPDIKVSGPPLDPSVDGWPNLIQAPGHPAVLRPDPAKTYDSIFGMQHLRSLPSAWGRSLSLLRRHLAVSSAIIEPIVHSASGEQPAVTFDVPEGRHDLLGFNINCAQMPSTTVDVFWRTANEDFTSNKVITFIAHPGYQLVPMDSRATWLLDSAVQIALRLPDATQCTNSAPDHVQFFQRLVPQSVMHN